MTFYLGKVSCDMYKCASRVRVTMRGTTGSYLSVKASLNNFPRCLFKKGVAVEVEQLRCDGRKFRITEVFDVVQGEPVQVHSRVSDAEAFGRRKYNDQNWKAGEEKVRFYLSSGYFDHPEMSGVLSRAFGVTPDEYRAAKCQGTGLKLICTTDQFARFLIARNLNGIKNGFMDLNPKLIKSEPEFDAYAVLATMIGVTREQAKRAAAALGYFNQQDALDRLQPSLSAVLDVSGR